MMQQEFEKLTKVKVTSEEYNVIEAAYMACQEDKQVFCKQWLKKDGIRNLLKDRLAEIKSLNSTIKELEKKIDTLEDWKPSIKYGTHYSDTSYRSLSAACERNGKNLFAVQSDAEVFIAARFGFNASKQTPMLPAHNFLKIKSKGAYFYDFTDPSSVFFYLPLVWLQADFRIQRCEG